MKERKEFRTGTFVDYTGMDRQFVMAAVSQEVLSGITERTLDGEYIVASSMKRVSVAVSVCRPEDTFDESTGKAIALGKARKSTAHALYTTDSGLINGDVVEALLTQEMAFFAKNPGKYIAGYDEAKAKYQDEENMRDLELALSDEERACLNVLLVSKDTRVDTIYDLYNYYMAK